MLVFVPRYPSAETTHHPDITSAMLAEISPDDLLPYLRFIHNPIGLGKFDSVEAYFRAGLNEACNHAHVSDYVKDSFEPFLRRPHITVFSGARPGSSEAQPLFTEIALRAGDLIHHNGFSLWYGGGTSGLMGKAAHGFNLSAEELGQRPDQYLVQIIPYKFVLRDEELPSDALRPVNEGLSHHSDAAVILGSHSSRRELLSNQCTAIFVLPGAPGTLEELFGAITANKIGLRDIPIYVIDPHIASRGRTFFAGTRMQIDDYLADQLDLPQSYRNVFFVASPQEAMDHLLDKLEQTENTPKKHYRRYCAEHGCKPGIPLNPRPHAIGAAPAPAN